MSRPSDDGKAQDLHFKMSKKIAQLTKVIYQLNCRNEDGDAQVRSVADRYEEEIASIMGDAKTKIGTLRDELATKNDSKKLESVVKELSRQHDKEKEAAIRELEALKKSLLDKEGDAKKNFEERMLAASREVAKAKDDFNAALSDIRATSSNSASEMDAFRKKKDEETDALVKEYNERYKAMLAQQMDEQDQLEKRLNSEWGAKVDALQAEMTGKVGSLSQLLSDEQAKCKQLTDALNTSVKEVEHLKVTIAGLEADIAERAARESGLSQGTDSLAKELATTQAQLKRTEAAQAALTTDLAKSQEANADLESEIAQLKDRIARLTSDGTDKDNEIGVLTTQTRSLGEQLEQLRGEIANMSASGSDAQQALQAKIKGALEELAGEKAAHTRTQGGLTKEQESNAILMGELKAAKEQWEKEVAALNKAFADERSAAASNASGDVAALQAKHDSAMADLKQSLQAAFDQESARTRIAHQQELDALRGEHDHAMKDALTKQQALQASIDELKAKIKMLEDARDKLSSQLSGETGALQRDLETTQRSLVDLKGELAARLAEHAKLVEKLNSDAEDRLKKELEAAKADFDAQYGAATKASEEQLRDAEMRYQTMKSDLEAQIAQLKRIHSEELDALRKQHAASMDGALSAQGKDAKAQQDAANAKLRADLQATHDAEKKALIAAHNDAIATLTKQLASETAARAAERKSFEEQLSALKASSSEASSGLEGKLRDAEAELIKARQAHRDELASLEKRLSDKLADTEQSLNAKYNQSRGEWEAKIEALDASYQAKLDTLSADARAAQKDMDESYKSRIASLEKRKDDERTKVVTELTNSYEDKLAKLKSQSEADVVDLQTANRTLTNEVRALSASERELNKQLDTTTGLYQAEKERVLRGDKEREMQLKRHQQDMNALKQELEHDRNSALAAAHHQHAQEIESLNANFDAERTQFNSKIKQLKRVIGDLEYKYANRESRTEDVEKINSLLKDLREKDEALLKAYTDMKFYKLELVNREESYNKVFGRQPNIAGGAAADGRTVAPSSAPAKGQSTNDTTGGRTRVKSLK